MLLVRHWFLTSFDWFKYLNWGDSGLSLISLKINSRIQDINNPTKKQRVRRISTETGNQSPKCEPISPPRVLQRGLCTWVCVWVRLWGLRGELVWKPDTLETGGFAREARRGRDWSLLTSSGRKKLGGTTRWRAGDRKWTERGYLNAGNKTIISLHNSLTILETYILNLSYIKLLLKCSKLLVLLRIQSIISCDCLVQTAK